MSLWTISGCHLKFTLPVTILEPVLSHVDAYMVCMREDSSEALEIMRRSVQRREAEIEISYELPMTLFDCRPRAITANCLLVEDGIERFELGARNRSGATLEPEQGAYRKLHGAVDYFDGERLRGWAILEKSDTKPLEIGVFLDNRLIGTVAASELRRDIQRRRGGDGLCGFHFALPNYLFDGDVRFLCVAPLSTLRPLRNGHLRVDLPSIETTVMTLIRGRIERLESLLD